MRRSTIDEVNARVAGVTVPRRFLELAAARPDAPMLHARGDGGWTVWTAGDVRERAAHAAQGLLVDRVAEFNRINPDLAPWGDSNPYLANAFKAAPPAADPVGRHRQPRPERRHGPVLPQLPVGVAGRTPWLDRDRVGRPAP